MKPVYINIHPQIKLSKTGKLDRKISRVKVADM